MDAPEFAAAPRDRLNQAGAHAQAHCPHLVPIYVAVRDYGVMHAVYPHQARPSREALPPRSPWIATLGDDFDIARGPAGFHRKTLRDLIRGAGMIGLAAGAPVADLYVTLAGVAAAGRSNALLVETNALFQDEWLALIQRLKAPATPVMAAMVRGGAA